jgi:Flp pilus assembly protein TadD
MRFRAHGRIAAIFLVGLGLLPCPDPAQGPGGLSGRPEPQSELTHSHLVVYVRDTAGAVVDTLALVTLTRTATQAWQQMTAQGGQATFDRVFSGRYTLQVVAGGYDRSVTELEIVGGGGGESAYVSLRPESALNTATPAAPSRPLLAPKAQKELGKALEALRAGNLGEARKYLDAAYRLAPTHPDVNFLFGVYSSQSNDWRQAQTYWSQAISFDPQHLLARISLSEALLRSNQPGEARTQLRKALEIDPNAWRAHAFLAEAALRLGLFDEAAREAERSMALGRERAAALRPILAKALAAQGGSDRAIEVLEAHLREHASDNEAQRELARLRAAQAVANARPAAAAAVVPAPPRAEPAPALDSAPLPSNWLPPDVDEKVPPVEAGVPCALAEVVENAGKRVEELVRAVDRFSATESLLHEAISAWGLPAPAEKRTFNYVASIEEVRPGILDVYEYRDGRVGYDRFPGGVATLGLPSLVLIFHPYSAGNYAMQCEGLTRWNGKLAWQIHFRQRPDRVTRDKVYRFGESGVAHPAALKGRAWIAADTFEIVRLETDLVAPLPEIRLLADHTIVEYGAVRFRQGNVQLWLPESAEIYSDLRGRRIHRRHTFSNYVLFSVDERQKISPPKTGKAPAEKQPSSGPAL